MDDVSEKTPSEIVRRPLPAEERDSRVSSRDVPAGEGGRPAGASERAPVSGAPSAAILGDRELSRQAQARDAEHRSDVIAELQRARMNGEWAAMNAEAGDFSRHARREAPQTLAGVSPR